MNAVQTFWTKKDVDISCMTGGWVDIRFHLLSWALSASLLKRYFQKAVLHTDLLGKQLLIDELKLPYDKVHLTQQGLDEKYPSELWVIRKMHTYSLMNEPFLHVDGDAFFFHSLRRHLLDAQVIVQNYQLGFVCYPKAAKQLASAKVPLPSFIKHSTGQFDAVNMGIVGGHVPQLFRSFFKSVNEYISKYQSQILQNSSYIDMGYLNTLLEECFFFHYTTNKKVDIVPLIDQKMKGTYMELGNLMYNHYNYFHLIGAHKKNLFYCKLIENKLKTTFPDTYIRVINFINSVIGSNHHTRNLYSFQNPFAESNSRLEEKGYSHQITLNNYLAQLKKFHHLNETQVCETILFEKEKHVEIQEQLCSKSEYVNREKASFTCYVNYLELLPIQLRCSDSIQYDGLIPVFRRKVTEGPHESLEIYLSLVFDFHCGFKHVGEKIWSDLCIFILCSIVSRKTTISEVLNSVLQKIKPSTSEKRAELINCVDLRIKELYLLGLVNYTITPSSKTEKYIRGHSDKLLWEQEG